MNPALNPRRGASLIEMLVVMSLASSVLTLSALLIHRTMRASSRAQTLRQDDTSAWRLSSQLRRDAAGATSVHVTGGEENIRLAFTATDGGPAEYRFGGAGVERTQTLEGRKPSKEVFVFASADGWDVQQLDAPQRVAVTAKTPVAPGRVRTPLWLRVVARLGAATAKEASGE